MTKQDILNRVNVADIYLHYLQLNKFPDRNISSPFTEDKTPSFRVYKNGTFKCFSSGHQGDVWQFVADLKHLDCKKDFHKVISTICTDLNIISATNTKSTQNKISVNSPKSVTPPLKKERGIGGEASSPAGGGKEGALDRLKQSLFRIETTDLTDRHFDFYNQYGVSTEILQAYGVRGVKKFEFWQESKKQIVKFPIYDNVIAFAYEVNSRYEIYIPEQLSHAGGGDQRSGVDSNRTIKKFFYNNLTGDDIFGLSQLEEFQRDSLSPAGGNTKGAGLDHIIIAAGKKDCLVLNADGYNSVSFRSENHFPTETQISDLATRTTQLYICYDNDFSNPNNPGQEAQRRIIEKYPFIIPIYLPDGFNDVADLYYKGNTLKESFELAKEQIAARSTQTELYKEVKKTIFHIAEEYLEAHYKIRYNSIKLEIQYCPVGTNAWKKINENSLFIEMQKKSINISIDKLVAIIKSDFTQEYNPVSNYFKNLPPWDPGQTDYIAKLASYITAKEPDQFLHHLKKWLVRSVKCATIPDYFNKQALIFVSPKQNDGKSTFCRFLCPPALSDYIAEDITNDKDARILLCRNFLINLDELAVLSKQEINSLKAFFSKTQINERLPYDRTNSIIPRIASFIGSTNQDEFLSDETGSVRWLCFTIFGIDWNYKKEIDINKVWSQAYYLAYDETFDSELTRDDIAENEKRNKDFQILSVERELINKSFKIPNNDNFKESLFFTATEVMQHIIATEIIPARGLSKVAIGRAMKQEGFERDKHNGIYGYHVIPVRQSGLPRPYKE